MDINDHILTSLDRIEKKLDVYDEKLNSHIAEDSGKFEKMNGKINEVRQELKFHSRLGSMVAVLVGSVISWVIEVRRNG